MTVLLDALGMYAQLEHAVVLAERTAGITPHGVSRPLYQWEQHTNFAGIDDDLDKAYARAAEILAGLQDTIVIALVDRISGIDDPNELAVAIRDFAGTQPVSVAAAIDDATGLLVEMLLDLHQTAARRMAGEAALVGAFVGVAAITAALVRPQPRTVEALAVAATTLLWQRLAYQASAAAVPNVNPRAIVDTVQGTKIDGALDMSRQAAHIANGQGRLAVASQLDDKDIWFYGSEILDTATCVPCERIDGTRYSKLRDVLADYPDFGPYKFCSGGSRCRGTVVIVRGEAPPTLR